MKGFTHLYYGDGKGKTTAAVGLSVRAAGHGKKVLFLQFLKGRNSGELSILEHIPNITIRRGTCGKFSFQMTDEEKLQTRSLHDKLLAEAIKTSNSGKCDMLVLDEILHAINADMINEKLFKDFIINKPDELELVLTGHHPKDYLFKVSDYITEMKKIKHPFDKGIKAREGIEY